MITKFMAAYLLGRAEITSLVSTRVHPAREPQEMTFPCITFWKLPRRGGREYGNDGPAAGRIAWIQVECQASTYAQAQALGRAVSAAMEAVPAVAAGVTVASAELVDDPDGVDDEAGSDDDAIYKVVQTFSVLYAEPAT